jgi:hypothetical protein
VPSRRYRDGVALLPTLAADVAHAVDARGWLRCDIEGQTWLATFREVADVADPASPVADGAAFVISDGVAGARRA